MVTIFVFLMDLIGLCDDFTGFMRFLFFVFNWWDFMMINRQGYNQQTCGYEWEITLH